MFEDIKKYLKGSYSATNNDISAFKKWEECAIDTEECIRRFKFNNEIFPFDKNVIDSQYFERWLNSLGYKRS